MKKYSLIALSVLVLFLIFLPAVKAENEAGIISARGSASIDVKPNTASLTISVETKTENLQKGIEENNVKAQKVYESLKKLLKSGDEIKTTRYQVFPLSSYKNRSKTTGLHTGYSIRNQVNIETKQIDKLDKLIKTALDNGANRISGLNYSLSDKQKYCEGLLDKAAKDARKEAEILAKSLGVKIVGIKKVSSSCNDIRPRPYGVYALREEKGSAPPIEAGEIKVEANVFIDFIIE